MTIRQLFDLPVQQRRLQLRAAEVFGLAQWHAYARMGLADTELGAAAGQALGIVYFAAGRPRDAVPMLEHSVSVLRQHLDRRFKEYLTSVYWCVLAYSECGRVPDGMNLLEEGVIEARARQQQSREVADLEMLLGEAYGKLGHFDRARPLLLSALAQSRAAGAAARRAVVECLARLGQIDLLDQRFVAARQWLAEARAAIHANAGELWAQTRLFDVEMLAGEVASEARSWEEALGAYERALSVAMRMKGLGDERVVPATARVLRTLFVLDRAGDVLERAAPLLEIDAEDSVRARPNEASDIYWLCAYAARAQEWPAERAQDFMIRSLLAKVASVRNEFEHGADDRKLEIVSAVWSRMREVISGVTSGRGPTGDVLVTLYDLVIEFKGSVADAQAISREERLAAFHPDLRAEFDRLTEIRRTLHATFAGVFQGVPASDDEAAAGALRQERARIEARLLQRVPEFTTRSAPTVADVASALEADAVLIDFVRLDVSDWDDGDGFAVFLLPGGRADLLSLTRLTGLIAIRNEIQDLRQALLCQRDMAGSAPDFEPLWRMVWRPITVALRRFKRAGVTCRRLIISADDVLTVLPFQVLRNPEWPPDTYLVDHHAIEYVTGARGVLMDTAPPKGSRALAIGLNSFDTDGPADDRELDTFDRPVLQDLAFAEEEARLVAASTGGDAWTGPQQVEKQRILARLAHVDLPRPGQAYRSPWLLHIATHGFCEEQALEDDGEWPPTHEALRRCGIALAGAEDWARRVTGGQMPARHDGVLDGVEVSGLDLRDTALTILSACDSGVGSVRAGEGMIGLQRAFAIAGSRGMIVTLWSVRDQAMPLLMGEFYRLLIGGVDSWQALREAQMAVRRQFPAPSAWAGCIAVGASCTAPRLQGLTPDG